METPNPINYLEVNRESWNARTDAHYDSDFYDNENFIKGKSSLNSFELDLLGDLQGKSVLHLQCHFGQDTISLTRHGATRAMGVDLSDNAINKAQELASITNSKAEFICCDVYDLPQHVNETFDVVFTSYGTIVWLPDLDRWAQLIAKYLKPGGMFVFADFHPLVLMFDDDFKGIQYSYFNEGMIIENESGTYADREASMQKECVTWNHPMSEVFNSLTSAGLEIKVLNEHDYSPYNCFSGTEEYEKGKFRVKHFSNRIPMVYALMAVKKP